MKEKPFTSNQVREIRKSFGMTQQEFADEVGVHRTTIARWETGVSPVGLLESNAIRRFLERRDRGAA